MATYTESRISWVTVWASLALVCAFPARARKQAAPPPPPFELVLNAVEGEPGTVPALEARLRNLSDRAQWVLHHRDAQSSRLVIRDQLGREWKATDTRRLKPGDATPYAYLYRRLAPGDEILLFRAAPEKDGAGGYDFDWGPYHYDHVHPGLYSAQVFFEAKPRGCRAAKGSPCPRAAPWRGSLSSGIVTIKLPEAYR